MLSPLLAALLLPVWTVWNFGPWEGTAESGMFWSVLRMLPHNILRVGSPTRLSTGIRGT